ncbi:MAG: hypothetical protein JWR52_2722 [Marmoricola sp.]|nr:hypothetical protein [Marmoricola sp.]
MRSPKILYKICVKMPVTRRWYAARRIWLWGSGLSSEGERPVAADQRNAEQPPARVGAVRFVYDHPEEFGVALFATIWGSIILAAKYSDRHRRGSKPRDQHLVRVRDSADLLLIFSSFPLIGTLHRSDGINDHQRHFGYVALIISVSMISAAVLIRGVWWLLAGSLAARPDAHTGRSRDAATVGQVRRPLLSKPSRPEAASAADRESFAGWFLGFLVALGTMIVLTLANSWFAPVNAVVLCYFAYRMFGGPERFKRNLGDRDSD